ncbi:hypothetical protein Goe25_02060 [Bacillus phage vB_BsuM-Goe25]|nr:hypothetical protein Goe25_02060 [Bacillus phage vB_BsuM-Goe25]
MEFKVGCGTLFGGLAILFTVLKLTGSITWSWVWVTAPLWVPSVITLALMVLGMIGFGIVSLCILLFCRGKKSTWKRNWRR